MDGSREIADTVTLVVGDLRYLTALPDRAVALAQLLEEASYDLALRIIGLESQVGETEQVLFARDELRQMDEHLAWVEHHRHDASDNQLLVEVDGACLHAAHILDVLDIT